MSQLICNFCPRDLIFIKDTITLASPLALPGALGAGAAWLVGSATHPLVAGGFGPITVVVAFAAATVFKSMSRKIYNDKTYVLPTLSFTALNVVGSLIATAIGFPVSIPLSVLLATTTAIGFWVGAKIDALL